MNLAKSLLEQSPRNPSVLHIMGLSLHLQGRSREAVEPLEKACSLLEDPGDIYYDLGVVLLSMSAFVEAIEAFDSSLSGKDSDAEAFNNIAILVELDDPEGGFMPELSFGSHFFLDLVETNIFYVALFMDDEAVSFNQKWITKLPNKLLEIIPEAIGYEKVIKVCDFVANEVKLLADLTEQKVICESRPSPQS